MLPEQVFFSFFLFFADQKARADVSNTARSSCDGERVKSAMR